MALAKNLSSPTDGWDKSLPSTLGRISTPRMPSLATHRSRPATANSAFCSGTDPSGTKRSGHVAAVSATRSFTARDFQTRIGITLIGALMRRRSNRLDIDAHPVHVLETDLDRRQLGRAVVVLLRVDLAR